MTESQARIILGVSLGASETSVRSAYRRLTLRWHPDRCTEPTAHEKMAQINEAFRVLTGTVAAQDGHGPTQEPYTTSISEEERIVSSSNYITESVMADIRRSLEWFEIKGFGDKVYEQLLRGMIRNIARAKVDPNHPKHREVNGNARTR